jgi:hypothetical protein
MVADVEDSRRIVLRHFGHRRSEEGDRMVGRFLTGM